VLGDLPAAALPPSAGHVGLAPALALTVLRLACGDLPRLREGPTPPPVHIPVSLATTVPTTLVTLAREALDAGTVRPGEIVLDVTGTGHATDLTTAGAALTRLHELGFPLALIDSGPPGSGLATLRELPIEQVSLPPGIITAWAAPDLTDRDVLIRDAYLELLRAMEITILAPDITDERTARAAVDLGISLATGDLFDAPHPADTAHPARDTGPVSGSGHAGGRLTREAQSWSTAVTRTTAAPASSEAARSISALMPQS
jgi:EAL domain-containing protein (putative c-di-GMP-specific phosphodiesterase class I)